MMKQEKRKEFGLTHEIKYQLRDIAKELPECVEEKRENIEVDGEWLRGQGVESLKRGGIETPVLIGKKYIIPDPNNDNIKLEKVPHFERLCKSYRSVGIKGIFLYVEKVQTHIQIMAAKYPEIFEQAGDGVKAGDVLAGQN